LQRANGLLERQTLHTQEIGRRALPIPDDGRQHDRTVDLGTPPLPRGRGRGLENSFQIG
jgi:hypothetical protein